MGALTSKPFAFVARSWELVSVTSVDVFDASLASIRVDVRGSEVMRLLPELATSSIDGWITDKARFSYDGLKRARVAVPMLSEPSLHWSSLFGKTRSTAKLLPTSWASVVGVVVGALAAFRVRHQPSKIADYLLLTFSELLSGVGPRINRAYSSSSVLGDLGVDSKFCVFFGINPRYSLPLVNIQLLRKVSQGSLRVLSTSTIGFNYKVTNIGGDIGALSLRLLSGKHRLLKEVTNKLPCFINEVLSETITKVGFCKKLSWVLVPESASESTAYGFGKCENLDNFQSLSILESSSLLVDSPFNPVWYHTSHGSASVVDRADILTPSVTFTEFSGVYLDYMGNKKRSSYAANPILAAVALPELVSFILTLTRAVFVPKYALLLPLTLSALVKDYSALVSITSLPVVRNGGFVGQLDSRVSFTHVRGYRDYLLDTDLTKNSRPLVLASSRFSGVRRNFA